MVFYFFNKDPLTHLNKFHDSNVYFSVCKSSLYTVAVVYMFAYWHMTYRSVTSSLFGFLNAI